MLEHSFGVLNGVRLLLKASGAEKAYLCMEDNKPEAAEKLQRLLTEAKALLEKEAPVEVKVLPTRYPQGGERQLIQAVLDREVPMGGLPADVGVIVSNVGTAKAAADMPGSADALHPVDIWWEVPLPPQVLLFPEEDVYKRQRTGNPGNGGCGF